MKNRRIVLLDIGLDAAFDASMQSAQGLFTSLNADYPPEGNVRAVEADFVRSRDIDTVFSTMTTKCNVLHVMAHGDRSGSPALVSSDEGTTASLTELATWAADFGRGIATSAILADGCSTATGVWRKAIADCLQGPITYIGTSREIGWYEGTVFASLFYAALLRNRGGGVSSVKQAMDAAVRADEAYLAVTGQKKCPFRATELEPSAKARRTFA